jgi:hypothetical protein
VRNAGDGDAVNARVTIWLSDDDVLDASDRRIATVPSGAVRAGGSRPLAVSAQLAGIPGFELTGRRVIAEINEFGILPDAGTAGKLAISDPLP